VIDIFDNGTPKYQSPHAIYDGLNELEQSEEINILSEMFPDVSYERQGYYYQDEGSRLKEKFEQITDFCNIMWLMEVALWQMSGKTEYGYTSYPEVHDLVFEVLINSDFAKRIGFKKMFVDDMLLGENTHYKSIIEEFESEVRELNRFDFNSIGTAFHKIMVERNMLRFNEGFGVRYRDLCNHFYKKLQRVDARVEAAIITECRSLLTSYDDFIRGLRVNQELYNGLERAFGERRAALTAEHERLVKLVLSIANKHGLTDEIGAEIKQVTMQDIPLLEGDVDE
jgi:hypothetical protein